MKKNNLGVQLTISLCPFIRSKPELFTFHVKDVSNQGKSLLLPRYQQPQQTAQCRQTLGIWRGETVWYVHCRRGCQVLNIVNKFKFKKKLTIGSLMVVVVMVKERRSEWQLWHWSSSKFISTPNHMTLFIKFVNSEKSESYQTLSSDSLAPPTSNSVYTPNGSPGVNGTKFTANNWEEILSFQVSKIVGFQSQTIAKIHADSADGGILQLRCCPMDLFSSLEVKLEVILVLNQIWKSESCWLWHRGQPWLSFLGAVNDCVYLIIASVLLF
jgi:hypothetical protein